MVQKPNRDDRTETQQPQGEPGGQGPRPNQPSTPSVTQNPNRDPAEGARGQGSERQRDDQSGRRTSLRETERQSGGGLAPEQRDRSGGITNRGMARELSEQEELPERGRTRD